MSTSASLLDRRTVLAAIPTLVAWPSLADAPPPLATYERETGGRIGVFARNLVTGAELSWRADERFVMCSTFKASLAACALQQVDRGADKLDAMVAFGPDDIMDYAPVAKANLSRSALSVEAMCQAAVELSDNTCANKLLARLGGPAALTRFWRATGDGVSRLDHYEPELNRSPPGDPHDATTPAAMAGTLQRLVLGDALTPASRQRLKGWLLGCKTGGNRLRGGLPAAWAIGNKTGNNGKDAFGDIALAWPRPDRPVLVAAYTQGGTPKAAEVAAVFAEIGQMVAHRLA